MTQLTSKEIEDALGYEIDADWLLLRLERAGFRIVRTDETSNVGLRRAANRLAAALQPLAEFDIAKPFRVAWIEEAEDALKAWHFESGDVFDPTASWNRRRIVRADGIREALDAEREMIVQCIRSTNWVGPEEIVSMIRQRRGHDTTTEYLQLAELDKESEPKK